VVSNWSSGANQQRYDSASVNIVVMFTTYDTASTTLRNITDNSGMFAFCWDAYITNIQRFGIASASTIGGIDLNRIDPSTFEGGYSFTCNGSYSDNIPTFRTQNGTITFRGGTSTLPNYFFPAGGDFPWAVTFGSNSYFRLPPGAFCYGIRTDVSFAFTMSGCTIESTGSSRMYFSVINLNQAGTNIFICSDTQVVEFNATYTGSASVIVARGTGLTFQGVSSPSLILYGQGSGAQSTVYLPSVSNYSLSTTTYRACSFSDSYGSSGAVYINPDPSMDTTYLYTITLTGQYATCVYSHITVQSHATITTTQSADFYRSLIILGILNYGQQSTFSKGVNNFISGGIFIGNSTINSTTASLNFYGDYQGATVTINSGQVTFPPTLARYILPDLVVNSINASSATTLALLNSITYDEFGSPSTIYRPYIRNLTLAATGTINFTSGTALESDPLNPASTRTWELGGRTIEPTVIVSNNSRLDITDTANLGTTYIKNLISSTSDAGSSPSTLRFQSGGTFTFDKFFHDPTVYALILASTTSGTQINLAIATRNLGTIVQGTNPGGVFTATITDCAVTSGSYIWYAGKYYNNLSNNSGWIFAESPTQLKTQFFL
jgi:hypothetical protein